MAADSDILLSQEASVEPCAWWIHLKSRVPPPSARDSDERHCHLAPRMDAFAAQPWDV